MKDQWIIVGDGYLGCILFLTVCGKTMLFDNLSPQNRLNVFILKLFCAITVTSVRIK